MFRTHGTRIELLQSPIEGCGRVGPHLPMRAPNLAVKFALSEKAVLEQGRSKTAAFLSVVTRFDVPMITSGRDGRQRYAVEWKRRPVMLSGGVCA